MAKLKPGPFGLPIGRIGNTVFYILNGQGVCRNIGEQNNPATPKQNINRKTMKATMDILKPMQLFIKHGFEHQAKGTVCNAFNLATSYNKHHAIKVENEQVSIDYAKVKLSSGTLPLAKDIQVNKTENGLKINWDPTQSWTGDQYDDLVMVALYHPKDKKASLFMNAGKRDQGECVVEISDENLRNEPIEAYLCFKAADGKTISDSIYLGNINGTLEITEEQKEQKKKEAIKNRLKDIEPAYLKLKAVSESTGKRSKAYRDVKKEYEVLKEKLKLLPDQKE